MAIASYNNPGGRRVPRIYSATAALIGWLTLLLQLYLLIQNRTTTVAEAITQFFGFFTILTNILTALSFTSMAMITRNGRARFFARPEIVTAITVYIVIVGAVYNIILRPLWNPTGLQKIVDESLHTVIPLLFLFCWLMFIPKKSLQWKNVLPWMVYPFLYLVFILIRGSFVGYYPYPFVDVIQLGYSQVFINSGFFVIVFAGLSLVFVGIGKFTGRN